jgi:hypothetical protein
MWRSSAGCDGGATEGLPIAVDGLSGVAFDNIGRTEPGPVMLLDRKFWIARHP